VYLSPAPASGASNPLDFRESRRLMDEGYRLASEWLASGTARPVRASDAPSTGVDADQGGHEAAYA
jgi:hypothetical protein